MIIAVLRPGGMRSEEDLLQDISAKTVTDEDDGLTGTAARRTFVNQVDDQTCYSIAG